MSIVLVCDGLLEQYSCHHLADAWRLAGRDCLVVGPRLPGDLPLPNRVCDLTLHPKDLLGSTVLEQASAIGLFLRNSSEIQAITTGYRALCRSRGLCPAPVFSGPLIPVAGDALVEAFLERLCCDLVMVSGDDQVEQLGAMTGLWPSELPTPKTMATGFWFPSQVPKPTTQEPLLVALLQKDIPTHLGAREQLIRQLMRWAGEQPEWTVVLQRDHPWSPEQKMTTDDTICPTNLVAAAPEQMLGLLGRCTACLTVSSPWSLAAMQWGRISVVVGDYGIHAEQQTTNFFGCGAMHRLRDLGGLNNLHQLPCVNSGWLQSIGGAIQNGPGRLLEALDALNPGSPPA